MDKDILSKNIIMYRKKNNLTQKQLADKLNYSDKVISKWERSESMPDIIAIDALAKFFDVSVEQLIGTSSDMSNNDVKIQDKKIELTHTKKPSIFLIWSILPVIAIWLYTISLGPEIFVLSSMILSVTLMIYAVLISYHTWETKYKNHTIVIENKPTFTRLMIDGVVVDQNHSIFKAGLKLNAKLDDEHVNVYLSSVFKIKCEISII